MAGQSSAPGVKLEALPAVEAAGPPAQGLVSRLAGATPGALGRLSGAADRLLKRKADLISSPALPPHLQPAPQGSSSSQVTFAF